MKSGIPDSRTDVKPVPKPEPVTFADASVEPVVNSLSNRLRLRIQAKASKEGEWPSFSLTLREVARQAGVNVSTLSRFMDGKPILSDTLDRMDWWCQQRGGDA